ncbi:2,3-diaminopropionate biosynthesis protein SbnB [Paenibacillus sp. IB182496]|uniref:2,3-diaminopropionate biosynthesis protein SbnB n=2 Tax=Paenibacillus sabuli TaxID=2772509 RepID=A0A927BQG2_9BACL|nr:2,3-diaminopropionate biosynthesis protein SbnB [Paenibacillus sabuli]
MLYLNDRHLQAIGLDWEALLDCIAGTIRITDSGDYAQPIKPYLRYGEAANRIIAMPAYVGGTVQTAGLKWIASFPGNRSLGLPRAHSVVVLNEAATGAPRAILNASLPSAARTAAVSGVLLRSYVQSRPAACPLRIGIIGFGPIGRLHYAMCSRILGKHLAEVQIYDTRDAALDDMRGAAPHDPLLAGSAALRDRTRLAQSWEALYADCNVILTCTVSERRYIDRPPQPGSLLLDVSLRDYAASALERVEAIVVDDWDEVCRENTDIELLHHQRGLRKEQTRSLADVVCRDALAAFAPDAPVLFCPMGMAAFDIATAAYWVGQAQARGIGYCLGDADQG